MEQEGRLPTISRCFGFVKTIRRRGFKCPSCPRALCRLVNREASAEMLQLYLRLTLGILEQNPGDQAFNEFEWQSSGGLAGGRCAHCGQGLTGLARLDEQLLGGFQLLVFESGQGDASRNRRGAADAARRRRGVERWLMQVSCCLRTSTWLSPCTRNGRR